MRKLSPDMEWKDGKEWKIWEGKKVYIQTKNSKHPYTGRVEYVDVNSSNKLIWISIKDKYNQRVTFAHTEIVLIKEDEKNE